MVSEAKSEAIIPPHAEHDELSRLDTFIEMALDQKATVRPQNADPFTSAYETAFADHLVENRRFRDFFKDLLGDMPDVEPDNVMRRTLKTFQHIEITNNYQQFPNNRATPESWAEPMYALLHNEDYQEQFYGNIFLPITSNISERGVLLKAVLRLHEMNDQVRVLDMGCSLNDVLHRLALERGEEYPELHYQPIEVMRRLHRANRPPTVEPEATRRFNEWLSAEPLNLGPSVGIDALPFDESAPLRSRALNDSRYMGELIMSHLTRQFYILAHARPEQVKFKSLDAATMDTASFEEPFDAAYASTMLYQASKEERSRILANAEAVTKPEGLIIIQDFLRRIGPAGNMQFHKKWDPYTYGVWVKDKAEPDLGYQKYFTVYSGRVEKIIPNVRALGRLPVAIEAGLVRPPRV